MMEGRVLMDKVKQGPKIKMPPFASVLTLNPSIQRFTELRMLDARLSPHGCLLIQSFVCGH